MAVAGGSHSFLLAIPIAVHGIPITILAPSAE
jgi:hypothetical protein